MKVWSALAALFLLGAMEASAAAPQRTVVLVLMDGFLPALLDAHPTPAFDRIEREGAWSCSTASTTSTICTDPAT